MLVFINTYGVTMNNTKIAWTNKTWNPITGCNAVSDGCKNCYAKKVHERFYDTPFNEIMFHPDRLIEPIKAKKEVVVFVGSMTDIFHESISDDLIDEVFHAMMRSFNVTFQVLTKRPQRMKEYIDGLIKDGSRRLSTTYYKPPLTAVEVGFERSWQNSLKWEARDFEDDAHSFIYGSVDKKPFFNVWFGVTAENQKEVESRVPLLLQSKVSHRFLSAEPLLESIDLENIINPGNYNLNALSGKIEELDNAFKNLYTQNNMTNKIDWVIVGGETGAKSAVRQMKPQWVHSLYEQCIRNKTSFFFKQWGAFKPNEQYTYQTVQETPKGIIL